MKWRCFTLTDSGVAFSALSRLELVAVQERDHDRDNRREECGACLGLAAVQIIVPAHGRADGDPALVQLHLLARGAVAVGGLARVLSKLVLVHSRDLKTHPPS